MDGWAGEWVVGRWVDGEMDGWVGEWVVGRWVE